MEKKYKIICIILVIIIIGLTSYIIINNNKKQEIQYRVIPGNYICPTDENNKKETDNEVKNTNENEEKKDELKKSTNPEQKKKELKKDENGNILIDDYDGKVGHSTNKYVGSYYAEKDVIAPEEAKNGDHNKAYFKLYLNDDGTFIYSTAMYIGFDYWGNYIIEEDQIILNFLFKGGHEATMTPYFHTTTLKIESVDALIDTNVVEYSENIGTKKVRLERVGGANPDDNKNYIRFWLENYLYINDPIL